MDLAHEIEAAFADVPYPGEDCIEACATATMSDEDGREIADYFRGKTNRGHSIDDLCNVETALFFFEPQAYHYFLPAFMLATIEDIRRAEAIPDLIVESLARSHRACDRLHCLSIRQKRAVRAFLAWLQEMNLFDRSIDGASYRVWRSIPPELRDS